MPTYLTYFWSIVFTPKLDFLKCFSRFYFCTNVRSSELKTSIASHTVLIPLVCAFGCIVYVMQNTVC